MKDGACFLNLSRGFVVDHEALAASPEDRQSSPAPPSMCSRKEPESGANLRARCAALPNVILTPHVGGSTEEAQANIGSFVSAKLLDYVRTGDSTAERKPAAMSSRVRRGIVPADAYPSQRARNSARDQRHPCRSRDQHRTPGADQRAAIWVMRSTTSIVLAMKN